MSESTQNGWRKRILLFLFSQSITLFGSTLTQMAIIWYVTLKTSSGAWVAAFTVCSYLPQFLISFVAGVWADRYNRKKLIVLSDALIALVTLVMILLMPHIQNEPTLLTGLLVMSCLRSLGAGVQTPAVNATIPRLTPEEKLMRYNGINAAMQSVMQFLAPAAAGLILTVSTLPWALAVDVITAALGIGMLLLIAIPRDAAKDASPASVLSDMKSGVSYALSQKTVGRVLAVYGLFIFLSVPAGFLAQLLVSRVYGDTYWYLTAMELVGFFGMTLGGVVIGAWGGFKNRAHTLTLGLFIFGALAIGMGLSKNFIFYLALMLVYGVALTTVQTAATTILQAHTEADMQGRVFGLMGSLYSGFLPLGMIVFGPMADAVPLNAIMIASGIALMLLAGAYLGREKGAQT